MSTPEVTKVVNGNQLTLTTIKDGVKHTVTVTDTNCDGIFDEKDSHSFSNRGAQSIFTSEIIKTHSAGQKVQNNANDNTTQAITLMNSNVNYSGYTSGANMNCNWGKVASAYQQSNLSQMLGVLGVFSGFGGPMIQASTMANADFLMRQEFYTLQTDSTNGNSSGSQSAGNSGNSNTNGTTSTNTGSNNNTTGNTNGNTTGNSNTNGTSAGDTNASPTGASGTNGNSAANSNPQNTQGTDASSGIKIITNSDGSKSTQYLVQPDQSIEDLVRISLKAQGKDNPTEEELTSGTEKFVADNSAKILTNKINGKQYVLVGETVILNGEVKDSVQFDTKEKAEAEWAKRHPNLVSSTYKSQSNAPVSNVNSNTEVKNDATTEETEKNETTEQSQNNDPTEEILSEIYYATEGPGTANKKLTDAVAKINKENILEVMGAWENSAYANGKNLISLIRSETNGYNSASNFWGGKNATYPLVIALTEALVQRSGSKEAKQLETIIRQHYNYTGIKLFGFDGNAFNHLERLYQLVKKENGIDC